MIAYLIPKRSSACKSCNKKFLHSETCISTLKKEAEQLLREDYCLSCPPGKGDASWKNNVELKLKEAPRECSDLVERFYDAFDRLSKMPAADLAAETYLLAHLLVRQKKLVLKKEPFYVESKKGALFQEMEGEAGYFIETNFSLFDLGEAKLRLKQPWQPAG